MLAQSYEIFDLTEEQYEKMVKIILRLSSCEKRLRLFVKIWIRGLTNSIAVWFRNQLNRSKYIMRNYSA